MTVIDVRDKTLKDVAGSGAGDSHAEHPDFLAHHFDTPQQLDIDHMNVAQCRQYLAEGHFLAGSMQPKIVSALAFLEAGGEKVIITRPHQLEDALHGLCGTHIVP